MDTSVSRLREELIGREDLIGRAWTKAFTKGVDAWLTGLLPSAGRVALVAVGSYGRQELCPYSDLDVIFLHAGLKRVEDVASEVWYPIWDSGVGLDHSVKTTREAIAVARTDLRAMLGLVDVRYIAGDKGLAAELGSKVNALWQRDWKKFLPEISISMKSRHNSSGELAFLLEPDLKESKGGLRDFTIYSALLRARSFDAIPEPNLMEASECILASRVELHRRANKAEDRLLLQEQDQVAASLGYGDADQLMMQVSESGRRIGYSVAGLARYDRAPKPKVTPSQLTRNPKVRYSVREGELAVEVPEDARLGVADVLEIASLAAHLMLPISTGSLIGIRDRIDYSGQPWPEGAVSQLVSLLGTGKEAIDAIESLEHVGIFSILFPEWPMVRSKPQRNAYHRFTVDRHLLEAASNASKFRREVHRPDLLLLGALLHDIGKGVSGKDHTEAGIELLVPIATRLGLSERDREVLVKLIEHHLLLADMAMRRDVTDPSTVERVATAVGDVETLELLWRLTEADSLATGPAAWSHWKEALIVELVEGVKAYLAGDRVDSGVSKYDSEFLDELVASSGEGCAVSIRPEGLFVAAPDRPGLFAAVTATLSMVGFSIVAADVFNHNGVAVEAFQTFSEWADESNWERFRRELPKAISKPEEIEKKLGERRKHYRKRQYAAESVQLPPKVVIEADASERATVVEVWGPDRIGLLHELTRTIAESGLDIRHAKVLTMGDDVIDTFYLVDSDGSRIVDVDRLGQLEDDLLKVIVKP